MCVSGAAAFPIARALLFTYLGFELRWGKVFLKNKLFSYKREFLMQIVGDELERLALGSGDAAKSDLLGRSAFNRYYYAAFLITRETLASMRSNWRGTAHAEIPNLLKTGLKTPAKTAIKSQRRRGLLDQGDESKLLTDLNATADELAQLLAGAYDARILADYQPEIKIVRTGSVITLKTYKLTTAKKWPAEAAKLCARLSRIWKEIGLA